MKIFIPFWPNSGLELKYTLRSIEKYVPNDGVVIASSSLPDWLQNAEHIHYQDSPDLKKKGDNTHGKLLASLPSLGNEFLAFMDDLVILQPWTFENYYCGKLGDVVKTNNWGKVIDNTIALIGHARNFELHCPMVYEAEKIKALAYKPTEYGLGIKSLYAEKYCLPGVEYTDMNFSTSIPVIEDIRAQVEGRIFVSLSARAMNNLMMKVLNELFPEKSGFER